MMTSVNSVSDLLHDFNISLPVCTFDNMDLYCTFCAKRKALG